MAEEQNRKEVVKKELAAIIGSAKTRSLLITKLASAGNLLIEAAALGIDLTEIISSAETKVKTYENIKVLEQIREEQAQSQEMSSLEKLRLLEIATLLAESEKLGVQHDECIKDISIYKNERIATVKKTNDLLSYLKEENIKDKDIDLSKFEGILKSPEEIKRLSDARKKLDKHKKELSNNKKELQAYNQKLLEEKKELERQLEERRKDAPNNKLPNTEPSSVDNKIFKLESEKQIKDSDIAKVTSSIEKINKYEQEIAKEEQVIKQENLKVKKVLEEVVNRAAELKNVLDPAKQEVITDFAALFENQEKAIQGDGIAQDDERRNKFIDNINAAVKKAKEAKQDKSDIAEKKNVEMNPPSMKNRNDERLNKQAQNIISENNLANKMRNTTPVSTYNNIVPPSQNSGVKQNKEIKGKSI